ncbi:hypothetical protein [Streptomyces sp. NPDC001401]|uniref:hypothetical protein n=1 Tax=Streptomyces sp. NPDC001401 TaxID=3364570 RepID=UPI00367DD71C
MTATVSGRLPQTPYDVAIVGAGVVGSALAHHPRLRIVLVEARGDVGQGIWRAGAAVLDASVAKKAGRV